MARAKKKKKFWDIEIPTIKTTTQLYAFSPEELENRTIKYDLTRFLRGKNTVLQLKVILRNGKPTCRAKELRILPTFLRKMIRKNTNYVEDSFSAECKDGVIRIKPFLITRRKVSRSVRKALRNKAREELIAYAKTFTIESLFREIIRNQIQKPLSLKLKKIYPLSLCEIRVLKVEKQLDIESDENDSEIDAGVELPEDGESEDLDENLVSDSEEPGKENVEESEEESKE